MLNVASLLPSDSFRLIYLDPPFLTGREQVGARKEYSYRDSWSNDLDTYLPWLQKRIEAIKPLLFADGSLVLHLDWRAAHYAKVMLDQMFGRKNFINEIIWHYTGGGRSKRRFSCKHDTLLWYSCGERPVFNIDAMRVPYKETSGYAKGGIRAASGKLYKPDPRGTPVDDVWDIPIVNPRAKERVGYPTQKPLLLLKRLIEALTAPGDLVGDFCCGSGTTLVSAEQLGRRWAGSDESGAAINCACERLKAEADVSAEIISAD
jgi:DNA modification methylase